ncbi:MAG: MFS transporter [Alphaproteobacteria bacterium]|nr:MFS transporter [Alphaproteobacteria bacterium]MDE2265580.1 MFS transporter [Alphaproteobacteria bacterium]
MSNIAMYVQKKTYSIAIILTVAMFAIWGLAHRLYDFLQPEFAAALSLNAYQTDLAAWALSLGYPLATIPAAMLTRNFGYKTGVMFGLGGFAVGMFLFYPAANQHEYVFLLAAALVIGLGLATLEIAADPLIVRLGPVESAVRRLNLAQTLNGIGAVGGLYLGKQILESARQHPVDQLAATLVTPYFFIGAGVLFFAFLADNTEFPPVARERVAKNDSTIADFGRLFSNRLYLIGAVALLICSVSQVVMWGFTVRYAQVAAPGIVGTDVLLWAFYAFLVGRVAGTALMYLMNPSRVLALFAVGGALCVVVAATAGGQTGIWCILGASFFLSVVFPTIFASAIRDLEAQTKSGSAFLMLAAGLGAIALALANLLVAPAAVQYVMIVPGLGFVAIAAYAVVFHRADKLAK